MIKVKTTGTAKPKPPKTRAKVQRTGKPQRAAAVGLDEPDRLPYGRSVARSFVRKVVKKRRSGATS